jgi:hypothetical protein
MADVAESKSSTKLENAGELAKSSDALEAAPIRSQSFAICRTG